MSVIMLYFTKGLLWKFIELLWCHGKRVFMKPLLRHCSCCYGKGSFKKCKSLIYENGLVGKWITSISWQSLMRDFLKHQILLFQRMKALYRHCQVSVVWLPQEKTLVKYKWHVCYEKGPLSNVIIDSYATGKGSLYSTCPVFPLEYF